MNGSWKHKIAIAINVVLGIILWFGYLTDYSFASKTLDTVFPPFVGIVGLLCLPLSFVPQQGTKGKISRFLHRILCLPSILGGFLSVLSVVLLIIPPFTLGFIFMMMERQDEVQIQQTFSPNGLQIAQVYFYPVGAYASGNGRVSVRVKPRFFPFIERDVYYVSASYANENTTDYVTWVDNKTLYISEMDQKLQIGIANFELASPIAVPINVSSYYLYRIREKSSCDLAHHQA